LDYLKHTDGEAENIYGSSTQLRQINSPIYRRQAAVRNKYLPPRTRKCFHSPIFSDSQLLRTNTYIVAASRGIGCSLSATHGMNLTEI
jgi:hypothetical protein